MAGFTRVELVVVVATTLVLVLLSIPFFSQLRARSRTATCASHLQSLGRALQMYTLENGERLPPAYLVYANANQVSWDKLLAPLLDPSFGSQGWTCPSDSLEPASWAARYNLKRRSYAMARHDMRAENWPPSSENRTGVGLWWSFGGAGTNFPSADIYNYSQTNRQAAVQISMVLKPATTLALTEKVDPDNISMNSSGAHISKSDEHMAKGGPFPEYFHRGRFNYLLLDGHVETLFPQETVGPAGRAGSYVTAHQGFWTLYPDD